MPKSLTPRGQAAPPVEPNVAQAKISKRPKKTTAKKTEPVVPESTAKFIRNLHGIDVRITIDGRAITLRPRGQRHDISTVSEEESNDAIFLYNVNQLFEVIDAATATEIRSKQSTNQQQGPSLEDFLTNEKGEAIPRDGVHRGGPTNLEQSFVAGHITPAADGKNTEGNVSITAAGPQRVAVPGSVENPVPHPSSQISAEELDEYREFLAWKKMRASMEKDDAE